MSMSESAGVDDTFQTGTAVLQGQGILQCMLHSGHAGRSFSNTCDVLCLHQYSIPCDPMGHIEPVHMGLAFLGLGGMHCLCLLASQVSNTVVVVMPAQTVLCTVVFNGMAPILMAMAMNYVPWDMVRFM